MPGFYAKAGRDFIGQPADFAERKVNEYIARDYHRPTDTSEKIDARGAIQILSLAAGSVVDDHLVGELIASEVEVRTGRCARFTEVSGSPKRAPISLLLSPSTTKRTALAQNWGRRYRALPPGERLAVLCALMAAEAERIRAAWGRDSHRVVLDERGDRLRTLDLAERLKTWQSLGQEVVLVIGGPDGLDEELRAEAQERIRLSDLTLPHAFVRVLLVEQLYRAWSILAHHPYHRE